MLTNIVRSILSMRGNGKRVSDLPPVCPERRHRTRRTRRPPARCPDADPSPRPALSVARSPCPYLGPSLCTHFRQLSLSFSISPAPSNAALLGAMFSSRLVSSHVISGTSSSAGQRASPPDAVMNAHAVVRPIDCSPCQHVPRNVVTPFFFRFPRSP